MLITLTSKKYLFKIIILFLRYNCKTRNRTTMKGTNLLVKTILSESPETRDDDLLLYKKVILQLKYNFNFLTIGRYLSLCKKKSIPTYDTVTRLRRLAQMKDSTLRGALWSKRHKEKKEKALRDMGYAEK